ncbi:MAG: anti-sigma factor family protein [Myxococcaceae bacterium]
MTCPEFERFLYPYLDGEFEPSEAAEVERHLAGCAACASRVHQERALHETLKAKLKGASCSPPAPEALRARIRDGLRNEHRKGVANQWARYAAAAAVVAVAGSSLYVYQRARTRQHYVADAAARHAKRLPLEIHGASPREIEAWLVGKFDRRFTVPSLPNAQLAGARLSNVQDKPAVYLVYDTVAAPGAAPRQIGLLVYEDKAGAADSPPAPQKQRDWRLGYPVVSHRDGDVVYQLVNDLDEADILRMLAAERGSAADAPSNPLPTLSVQPASFRP